MRVLLAGATGTLGGPLVRRLLAAGHEVTGLTRSAGGAERLGRAGAVPVVADVRNRPELLAAVNGMRFDAVLHELTALKRPPARHRDMAETDALRTRGTDRLLEVAAATGATRFVTQSIVFGYGFRDHHGAVLTEDSPFGVLRGDAFDPHVEAIAEAERRVFDTSGVHGIALRYGLFYGAPADLANVARLLRRRALPVPRYGGLLPFVHHEDAAAATVAALERGRADTAYNVVDDSPATFRQQVTAMADATGAPRPLILPAWVLRAAAPYGARVMLDVSMRVSNEKARAELGWAPHYPSHVEGLADSRR
jgi:nucleoside-diphosphate-sugar epimerase